MTLFKFIQQNFLNLPEIFQWISPRLRILRETEEETVAAADNRCDKGNRLPIHSDRALLHDRESKAQKKLLHHSPMFVYPFQLMLFATSLSIFMNDTSQFANIENIEENCKRFWWRNIIFIQNLFPLEEMCMSWSW